MEDHVHAVPGRRVDRGERPVDRVPRRERLVAVDPGDGADRKPHDREHEDGEEQVPGTPRPQERDRAPPALEPRGRSQVGVLVRTSQLCGEVGSGRKLGKVVAQLRDELAPHAPGQIAELDGDGAEVVLGGHGVPPGMSQPSGNVIASRLWSGIEVVAVRQRKLYRTGTGSSVQEFPGPSPE